MYSILLILIVLVCILLVFFVMVQKPKGGGLSSSFGGGGGQIGGVKSTNDFLEKATWTLITALFVLVLGTNIYLKSNNTGSDLLEDKTKDISLPKETTSPTLPAPSEGQGENLPTPEPATGN